MVSANGSAPEAGIRLATTLLMNFAYSAERSRLSKPIRSAMVALLLVMGSGGWTCGGGSSCDNDFDCPGEVCRAGRCSEADFCQTSEDCSDGEVCVQGASRPPRHPFESPTEGKQTCECITASCNHGATSGAGAFTAGNGAGGGGS